MKRVEIVAVGRLKDAALRALCDDFYRRCSRTIQLTEREVRDQRALEQALSPRTLVIALTERGEQYGSRRFAAQLQRWLADPEASRLLFAIGGADGLGEAFERRAAARLSLSAMTLGHRIARVVLAEQLYRAVSIIEGTPYHRD